MAMDHRHATLGVISFGLALAVTSAVFTFVLGLMATFFGWGVELAGALSSLYIGYGPTFVGTIAGAVWAFVDGFIAGIMVAWLYNQFLLRRAAQIMPRRAPEHVPGEAPERDQPDRTE